MKIFPDKIAKRASYQSNKVTDARSGAWVYTGPPGGKMKTKNAEAHTCPTKHGCGDYYGSGIKAPVGRMRGVDYPGMRPVTKSGLEKPPKSTV